MMQQMWMRNYVEFFVEMRKILSDYFSWPHAHHGHHSCHLCHNHSEYWCVDCGHELCARCTQNTHGLGTYAEFHSVEEIADEWKQQGVHILTPILPELLFLFLAGYALSHDHALIEENYLFSGETCPMVHTVQRGVASMNANVFFYFKVSFASWCQAEDSFFKLLLDTWVRSIVTGSDNTLLIFQTFYQAIAFQVVIVICLVPMLAFTYAVLFNVIYKIELKLPHHRALVATATVTSHLNVSGHPIFGCTHASHGVPVTKLRRRAAMDSMDALWYWWHRKVRYVHYFYTTTSSALSHFLMQLTMLAVAVRLGCIWLGLSYPLWYFFSTLAEIAYRTCIVLDLASETCARFDLHDTKALHETWFVGASGMFESQHSAWMWLKQLQSILTQLLVYVIPEFAVHGALWFLALWVMVWVTMTAFILGLSTYLVTQRRTFYNQWEHEGGRDHALKFESHGHGGHGGHGGHAHGSNGHGAFDGCEDRGDNHGNGDKHGHGNGHSH